jgi:hypothetical protein
MTDRNEEETAGAPSLLTPSSSPQDLDDEIESENGKDSTVPLAPPLPSKIENNTGELPDYEGGDEHKRYSVRHQNKLLVQTAESNSFDDLDHMLPSAEIDSGASIHTGTPVGPSVAVDTSETPTAALSEAVMENMDFEILPDDEEEDDNEVEGQGEEYESDSENILHRVEELSLEEDDDDDDEDETDDEDVRPSSELLKQNCEIKESQSFEHPNKDTEISAPSSPVTFKKSRSSESHGSKTPASPSNSHHRRRLSGFFTGSSQKKPLSPRRNCVQNARSNSQVGTNADIALTQSNDIIESTTSDEKIAKRGQRFTTLIRTTMGAIKDGIKSDASSTSTVPVDTTGDRDVAGVMDDDGSSSDESSYDEDEHWFEDEAPILFEDDIDQVVDCSTFTTLPNSFLGLPPDMYDYLDLDLVKNIKDQNVSTFAWEHHLFVKGLLQLLAERDMIGVEDDVHDSRNISKMGVLRKKHAKSGWRVKYLEVRKGNLTYFADKENEKRKTVHLRKRTCSCKGEDKTFELIVDNGKRLLWMAKSEQECQGWINAINQAMIGDTDNTRDAPVDLTTYQIAIDDFKSVQNSIREVKTRKDYLVAMNSLLYRQSSSSALRVPMKWIRDSCTNKIDNTNGAPNAPSELIRYTIRDFWESLCSSSIVLNGYLVEANSTYSAERVIGALTRCILEFDKVENREGFDEAFNSLKRASEGTDLFITELEAVSYARSILSGALQSASRGDLKAAVEFLFSGSDLACVKLESSEPLHIDVSFAGDDFSEDEPRSSDFVGWIDTKSKKGNKWKKRYFVASGGVLNYFEKADPRPYRLRGQLVLHDAKFSQQEGNILCIEAGEKERLLRFEDRTDLVRWKAIFDKDKELIDPNDPNDLEIAEEADQADDSLQPSNSMSPTSGSNTRRRARTGSSEGDVSGSLKGVRGAGAKFLKNAAGGMGKAKAQANRAAVEGMKRARNAKDAGMKSIRSGAGMFIRGVRRNPSSDSFPGGRRRPTQDMLSSSTRNMAQNEKREPTVQAIVEMNSVFKVVWRASSDEEKESDDLL